MDLMGKTVLITGASRGIGEATAKTSPFLRAAERLLKRLRRILGRARYH